MRVYRLGTNELLWEGADLRRADLRKADLRMADLRKADLSGADLRKADLRMAALRMADLSGAALRMANLSGADLRMANLSEANLSEANLSKANLSWANLIGVNLSGANLIIGGQRSDGYQFLGFKTPADLMIRAGCRYFSVEDARRHWRLTRKGTTLGLESLALVADLVTRAKIAGWKI